MMYKQKLSEENQLLFLKRLYRLLSNGYPILRALEVIDWEEKFNYTTQHLREKILEGCYIDQAFKACQFHPTILSFLYFTRVNNNLEESLEKSIVMFEQRIENMSKFRKIIRYPIFLSLIFFIVFIFLQFYVFPSFIELFATINSTKSNFETSLMLFNSLSMIFFLFLILMIILSIIFNFYKNKLEVEQMIQIYKRIPFIRYVIKTQTTYYLTTHMSMFLKAGLSLKDTLKHLENQKALKFVAFYSGQMRAELERGIYIDQLILQSDFIDNQVASIFRQNISMQTFEKDLSIYSELLQEKFQEKIQYFLKLVQPFFLMVIATLIIIAYLSLILPMLQMIQTI